MDSAAKETSRMERREMSQKEAQAQLTEELRERIRAPFERKSLLLMLWDTFKLWWDPDRHNIYKEWLENYDLDALAEYDEALKKALSQAVRKDG